MADFGWSFRFLPSANSEGLDFTRLVMDASSMDGNANRTRVFPLIKVDGKVVYDKWYTRDANWSDKNYTFACCFSNNGEAFVPGNSYRIDLNLINNYSNDTSTIVSNTIFAMNISIAEDGTVTYTDAADPLTADDDWGEFILDLPDNPKYTIEWESDTTSYGGGIRSYSVTPEFDADANTLRGIDDNTGSDDFTVGVDSKVDGVDNGVFIALGTKYGIGTYPVTVVITDKSDNSIVQQQKLLVVNLDETPTTRVMLRAGAPEATEEPEEPTSDNSEEKQAACDAIDSFVAETLENESTPASLTTQINDAATAAKNEINALPNDAEQTAIDAIVNKYKSDVEQMISDYNASITTPPTTDPDEGNEGDGSGDGEGGGKDPEVPDTPDEPPVDDSANPLCFSTGMVELLVTQILGKVNERIAARIVTTISEASDDKHVPSALAVFNFLRTLSPAMSYETVMGGMDTVENPNSQVVYLQKDDENDQTWTMYLWVNDEWVPIGDTSIDLVNYWSKSEADVAQLREKILGQEGLDLIKDGLNLTDVLRNDDVSKGIIIAWMAEYLAEKTTDIVASVMEKTDEVYVKKTDFEATMDKYVLKEELPAMVTAIISESQITSAVEAAFAATDEI